MAVHVVEEELVKSNASRAFLVGYLVSLSYDAIRQLSELDADKAGDLYKRLDEVYPLIEKEFYSGIATPRHVEPAQGATARVATAAQGEAKVLS